MAKFLLYSGVIPRICWLNRLSFYYIYASLLSFLDSCGDLNLPFLLFLVFYHDHFCLCFDGGTAGNSFSHSGKDSSFSFFSTIVSGTICWNYFHRPFLCFCFFCFDLLWLWTHNFSGLICDDGSGSGVGVLGTLGGISSITICGISSTGSSGPSAY